MTTASTIKKPKIVFMGTPEFAVSSLKKIQEEGYEIAAVVTAPDKPAGRGLELQQSPVKKFALAHDIPILQPEKLRNPDFLQDLKKINADVHIVVAFRMLPEVVWSMPPLGTINVHASLLPQYRGAAPINWVIINGEKQTGVTTFRLKHEIDTGDMLLAKEVEITPEENAGSLHDKLKETGAELLAETLKQLFAGTLKATPQPQPTNLHHAPKIFTETCQIDWNKSTHEIHNLIRGLSPYPAAFTYLEKKKLKIFLAIMLEKEGNHAPGMMETDKKNYLRFSTADGKIEILDLQLEGRKRMNVSDFLKGYRFEETI